MQRTVYRNDEGFHALRNEWNRLLQRSAYDTLFLTWEWQTTWWENLGRGELCLIAWHEADGSLVGIAPLFLERVNGQPTFAIVGCHEVSDYLNLIIAPDHEEAVCSDLAAWLDGPESPDWELAHLCSLPEISPVHRRLAGFMRQRGYFVQIEEEDVCPVIPLPATWEDYLAGLNKHQRHEVRRKMRHIQQDADHRWYIVGDEHDLQSEMDRYIELHQKSAQEKEAFMDEAMKRFFHRMAEAMQAAGWLQLAFIEVNGTRAATMLNFDYGDRILVYNSGYDPSVYGPLSPGIVLLTYCIQHAIAAGRQWFDFLQGDEAYKYRFGGEETKVYRMLVTRG